MFIIYGQKHKLGLSKEVFVLSLKNKKKQLLNIQTGLIGVLINKGKENKTKMMF